MTSATDLTVHLSNAAELAIQECQNPVFTRKSVALTIAFMIRQGDTPENMRRVTAAVVERWSVSGLDYVLRLAWAYVEGKKTP